MRSPTRGEAIAKAFVASLTMGAGQFCTNPGLLLGAEGADARRLRRQGRARTSAPRRRRPCSRPASTRRTAAASRSSPKNARVKTVARGQAAGRPATRARPRSSRPTPRASSPTTRCAKKSSAPRRCWCAARTWTRCARSSSRSRASSPITLQMDPEDLEYAQGAAAGARAQGRARARERFPDRRGSAHAMVHGGPFPSTSDGRTTSVGSLAIHRFLRPVCYQDFPGACCPNFCATGSSARSRAASTASSTFPALSLVVSAAVLH